MICSLKVAKIRLTNQPTVTLGSDEINNPQPPGLYRLAES